MSGSDFKTRLVLALAIAAGLGLSSIDSMAAGSDPAGAQVLFNDAKKLMNDGRWAEACPKLEESEKLDPGIGTEFNLALCYEHTGRTATAWALYVNVASAAKANGQAAREKVAREHAAAVESKVGKITVVVRDDPPGLKVTRNGVEVGRGQWGTVMPVDPGDQHVIATAPGKRAWEKVVRVAGDARAVTIEIPTLENEPAHVMATRIPPAQVVAEPPPPMEPPSDDGTPGKGNTQRILGGVTGAAGLVGLGIGTIFGLSSRQKRDEANGFCNAENQCSAEGLALRDDAFRAGTISTVAFVAGGAALVGGIVIFATAPHGSQGRATLRATPTAGGMSLSGRF